MKKTSATVLKAFAGSLGVLAILLLGYLGLYLFGGMKGHQMSLERVLALKPGMTKEEVVSVVGEPSDVRVSPTGQLTLCYASRMFVSCCCVEIRIDGRTGFQGGVFHDCLQ